MGHHLRRGDAVAERLAAQGLSGTALREPLDVVQRLLAVQAQDPRGFRLAIRARTTGLTAADVDRALSADRSVVVTWLNRGTLHLVPAEDYWWLHPLLTPPLLATSARRLAQEGVTPDAADRGVAVVERALTESAPLTRAELRDRISAAGVRVEGQALVHVLLLATLRSGIVRGPVSARGEQAFVLARDWLGAAPPPKDRDTSLALLAARYLRGHGPAGERDLSKWAGLPLRDVRRGLAAISHRLEDRADGLLALASPRQDVEPAEPRLLGAFDPVLLGWASRAPILAPHEHLVTVGGMFRPFALVHGRAVATWSMPRGRVELAPFSRLAIEDDAALQRDARDVERFLAAGARR